MNHVVSYHFMHTVELIIKFVQCKTKSWSFEKDMGHNFLGAPKLGALMEFGVVFLIVLFVALEEI